MTAPPIDTPLYACLATVAARQPLAPAVEMAGRCLNRADLLALADAMAVQWQAEGLGKGAFIGWLGHNSPEMLAALLACAKLGAVFVPLNWRLAPPELASIARHAGLSALKHTPELAGLAQQVLALAPLADCQAGAEAAQRGDVLLVYTSGTTGEPKGALHTQAGLLANIHAALAMQPLTEASRVLSVLPLFHVGGLCIQTLPALAAGAVVKLHARFDPAAWLHDVAAWRPDTSLLVPAVMKAVTEHDRWATTDLSSLSYINSGSQVVPLAWINAFHTRGVPVAQVYGSTETGPVSVALPPAQALSHAGRVGWPAPGVLLELRGATGQVVDEADAGTVGEIHLQADNLMRAYHRMPSHPSFKGGWLAMGDLALRHADGSVEVVGRSKDLIISGGENIHPAEIENLAASWPGVAECAVVGLPDDRWSEVPVLVLVAQPGMVLDLDALRAHFDGRLARFKHPRRWVVMDALPKTALGKVQKSELMVALHAHPSEQ